MTLTIGQVVERTGLSVHTLRLYERRGLLAGEVCRDTAGRRVYSAWDVEWLRNCVLFRASGMPLATIAELARLVRDGAGNERDRLEILRTHRGLILDRQAELAACLALVDGKVSAYEEHLAADRTGDPWSPAAAPHR